MSYRKASVIIFFCVFSGGGTNMAIAAHDWDDEKPSRGVVDNYHLFGKGRGKRDSHINYMQAELATRIDDKNRAIILGRKAVKLDPDDIDARVALGEALFEKIEDQENKDPKLFNECVKTWLMVNRNIVGDEAAMTHKGISIPGVVKFFEDEDRGILARERLKALCGRVPRMWETNQKYLDTMLMPEKSVSGKLVTKTHETSTESAKSSQKEK